MFQSSLTQILSSIYSDVRSSLTETFYPFHYWCSRDLLITLFLFIKSLRTCLFLRSPAHRFARCAAPRFTPPLLRLSSYGDLFYPFNSSCMRDWFDYIWFDYIWFDYIWEIDYIMLWEIGSIIFIYQISQNMSIPPLPRSSLRPLRGSAIHSSAASPVLIRRPFLSL
jgi:hypothetical protein